jgi:tetratricopeptide (TPR) repeat protein
MLRCILPLIFLLLAGCSSHTGRDKVAAIEDHTDFSCSYFYFLWGSHAEFSEQYAESLEAYEKALICDPKADYVKEKIPILMLKMGEFERAADWLRDAIAEHPENSTYKLFLANLYLQQEKTDKAITLYKSVLKSDPDNEAVHIQLALLYSSRQEYDTAEQIFRSLLRQNSDSYFSRLSLARLLKQRNNFNSSIVEYEKALNLNWSKELAFELGYLYVNGELYLDALRIYTTITDIDRFDERASLSRIQALLDLERFDEGLTELYKTRHFSDNPEKIDLIISKVLLRTGKKAGAKEILQRLVLSENNPEPQYMLALIFFQEEDYDSSLDLLRSINETTIEFEEAIYLQTKIYQKINELKKAVALLEGLLKKEQSRSPLFYAILSSLYQDLRESDTAISTLERAVEIYPENFQLFFEYGLLLEKRADHKGAIEKMQQVLRLNPDHAEALNFIGYTWADSGINLKEALKYIEKAYLLKPKNGFIVDSLGWVHYKLGNHKKAAQILREALELEPSDPHIYEHLGDVYSAQQKNLKALQMYRQAYTLFDNKKKKKNVQKKIKANTTD